MLVQTDELVAADTSVLTTKQLIPIGSQHCYANSPYTTDEPRRISFCGGDKLSSHFGTAVMASRLCSSLLNSWFPASFKVQTSTCVYWYKRNGGIKLHVQTWQATPGKNLVGLMETFPISNWSGKSLPSGMVACVDLCQDTLHHAIF